MTLTQLEAFVLVARLGSVKAAAGVLGVSEPAVSGALAALRRHLGDPLLVRSASGMDLTPGGQRLVAIASQMVNLAEEAQATIRHAHGSRELLRVVATSTVAEFLAPALLAVFATRGEPVEATVGLTTESEVAALLSERLADAGLGPRVAGTDSVPIMRYRLVVVAGPGHHLAGVAKVPRGALVAESWLVGTAGADPSSDVRRLLHTWGVPESRLRVFGSESAALVAAEDGQGLCLAVSHVVAPELDRGSLVHLPVDGTPADRYWYVSTLGPERRPPAADRFRRFLATPDAVHLMHRADGGVPAGRFRPPIYVTLWN